MRETKREERGRQRETCTCIGSATIAAFTGSGRNPSDPAALLKDPAALHLEPPAAVVREGWGGRLPPDPAREEEGGQIRTRGREETRARRQWMSRRRARKGARSRAQKPTRAPCPQRRRWMSCRERSGEVVTTEWRGDCLGLAWSGEWGGRLTSDSVVRNGEEVGPTGGGKERQRSGVEIGPC